MNTIKEHPQFLKLVLSQIDLGGNAALLSLGVIFLQDVEMSIWCRTYRRERINNRNRKGLRKSCLLALRGEYAHCRIEVPSEYMSINKKNQFLVKASKSFGAPQKSNEH